MIYSVWAWVFINMKSLWFSWDFAGLFWTINLTAVVIVPLWVTSTLYYSAERWILPVADDLLVKQNDYCVFHCKYRTPFICSGGIIGKESCLSNVSMTLWILMTDFMATFSKDNLGCTPNNRRTKRCKITSPTEKNLNIMLGEYLVMSCPLTSFFASSDVLNFQGKTLWEIVGYVM